MSRPDWLAPGATVAEVGGRMRDSVVVTKIDRVLKRDVVLTNGHRYNADRLVRQTGTWDPTYHLLPVDHERTQRALRDSRRRSLARKIEALCVKLRDGDEDAGREAYALLAERYGDAS